MAVKQKRRIYDITNVLEGVGLIEKKNKNIIQWRFEIFTFSLAFLLAFSIFLNVIDLNIFRALVVLLYMKSSVSLTLSSAAD